MSVFSLTRWNLLCVVFLDNFILFIIEECDVYDVVCVEEGGFEKFVVVEFEFARFVEIRFVRVCVDFGIVDDV